MTKHKFSRDKSLFCKPLSVGSAVALFQMKLQNQHLNVQKISKQHVVQASPTARSIPWSWLNESWIEIRDCSIKFTRELCLFGLMAWWEESLSTRFYIGLNRDMTIEKANGEFGSKKYDTVNYHLPFVPKIKQHCARVCFVGQLTKILHPLELTH